MAPKVDLAEALVALTAQVQDLKSSLENKLETNSSSIADLQLQFARLKKALVSPSSLRTPSPLPSIAPSLAIDATASSFSQNTLSQHKTPHFYLNYFDGSDPHS
ncbi:alkaline protease secretion ATP-binding protein AprD [Corchorus olitorius]|uniref:Alkaline protease secretion ATP-binding protein AprD n=1 Tax=Corchorus olitorius TaxID=93759 RepID=A0A1R3ITP4_9ROSI|nr:alkaline protease secretion ATP-binding protein AprD [Corchorus olitorius]